MTSIATSLSTILRLRGPYYSASLVGLACLLALAPASGQVWDGPVPGNWNDATNWVGDTSFPDGIDAVATFNTVGARFATQNITVGTININALNTGSSISIAPYSGTANTEGYDLVFDVSSGNAAINFGASTTGRIFLNNNGSINSDPARVILNDNLEINALGNPANSRRLFIQGDANSWVGNGNTLSLNGRGFSLQLEQNNPDTMTNITLDVRGGRNEDGSSGDADAVLFYRASQQGTGVTAKVGNNVGQQNVHIDSSSAVTLAWNYELYGTQAVNFNKVANGALTITGAISGNEGTTLNLTNSSTQSGINFTLGGTTANTYNGLTTVDFDSVNGLLTLAKESAIGGDLRIDDLGILDINVNGALNDGLNFTLNDVSTLINTGGFNLTLNSWTINGVALAAGDYSINSGNIGGFDFGTLFQEGAVWTVVPEPSAVTLLVGGLAVVAARRRRK